MLPRAGTSFGNVDSAEDGWRKELVILGGAL